MVYKCEVCEKSHKTEEEAKNCESGHTIIYPTKWWLIPLVLWILVPWYLITKKNCIVMVLPESKPKSEIHRFGNEMLRMWYIVGPILSICVYGIIYVFLTK